MKNSKVVVITGASSGIGAATAKLLGSQGYRLALAARREPELKAVARAASASAITVVTDVTRYADMENLLDTAIRSFGQIDIWINNAGRGINKSVLELTDEDLDAMMSVNFKAAFYGIKCIVPLFQARGEGHLINISSFLGRVPIATYRSAYNAAKSALNALTANLRVDLRKTHPRIQVSVIMPSKVTTEFAARAIGGPPLTAGRGGSVVVQSPEEVAAVIVSVIEKPVAEMYTNPALKNIVQQYYQDVAAFEEKAGFSFPV